ncbi:MAG: YdcF family protein [Pseudomonadota bacterium]
MDTVFFIASKVFWAMVQPEAILCAIIIAAAVLLRTPWYRWGRRFALLAALCVLALSFLPVWRPLLVPLENVYPANPDLPQSVAGIIVLGGAEVADMTSVWQQPAVNEAGERFLEAMALARRFPDAKLIFTGGSGALRPDRSGAEVAQQIFEAAGFTGERTVYERRSRNTDENARFLHDMIGAEPGPWVLITSAFHIHRSVATFCAAGWREIIPYPVDFRSGGRAQGFATNLNYLGRASKEWIGLLAYRMTGRALLPRYAPGCLLETP